MSSLQDQFITASANAKGLSSGLSNDQMLELYSLFKQASIGDCNTERPEGMFDIKGKAKWDKWNSLKGTSQEDAKKKYIELVKSLQSA